MNKLKILRIVVSLTFFVFFIFLFSGIVPYDFFLTKWLVHLQLIPALINSIVNHSFIFVLILIAVLTLVFGRVYCSVLCPFGTLQDVFIFLKYKFARNKFYKKQKNHKIFRYVFVAVLFVVFFSGSVTLLSIFEPYSNFGRITNEVIKPAVYFINNLISSVLQKFDLYSVKKTEMHGFNRKSFFYSLVIFILIGGLSFFKGRFFCNTLCPAGALLGLISKFSVFRIKISKEKCNSCGLCSNVCKAGCIDCGAKKIDNETCIYCFNCLDSCKKDGIKYSYGFFKRKTDKTDETKRDFLAKTMTGIITFAIATSPVKVFANSILIKKKTPVILPPGAQSMDNFRKKCTSCHLCVASCPTKVLTPAFNGTGLKNFLQPEMNYSKSYCLYDCNVCSQVCPTGAIRPMPVEKKKRIQIGVAKFIQKNCVVYENETDCGICNEYCPTKAVILVPYKNGLGIPFVRENICIGCGACENACPALPNKAIYVEGKVRHDTAQMPETGKQKKKTEEQTEFPF